MKIDTRFSRLGFILAAAGSAVGLGNVWKFPYITGENGGGAFVLIYLLTIVFIGLSLFIAEVAMGKLTRADPVSAYETLAKKKSYGMKWKFAGFSFLTALVILTFYPVVISWVFNYVFISVSSLPSTIAESSSLFNEMVSTDIVSQLTFYSITYLITFYVVSRGLKDGIEKINLILMPLLATILLILFFYATSLDGFPKALSFLFVPDFSKITPLAILVAVGHAFFTLSIGMAVIMTYGASLDKDTNLVKASVLVAFTDTAIALIAGIIVFSLIFTFGAEPSQGTGLVFISLPPLFNELGVLGNVGATLFFISLVFAGITTCVSLVEPSVVYLSKRLNMSRKNALLIVGSSTYFIGFAALLSNIESYKSSLTFFGKSVFDLLDFTSTSILLPIGGLLLALFVGFVIQKVKIHDLLKQYMSETVFNIWYFSIRFIVPIAILGVLINQFI